MRSQVRKIYEKLVFLILEGYKRALAVDDENAECCACDEAKYDLEFIGLWSRDTHPKDYPTCKQHFQNFQA